MSSIYSSAASSRRASKLSLLSSFTSPKHEQLPEIVQESLDLDALFEKLDKFQMEIHEVESQLELRRSVSVKEAEDMAAAERFRQGLESADVNKKAEDTPTVLKLPTRSSSLTPHRSPVNAHFPSHIGAEDKERNTPTQRGRSHKPKPLPLTLAIADVVPQEIQSASLLPRTAVASSNQTSTKLHRRRVTISESRNAVRNAIFISAPSDAQIETDIPPVPALSPSSSVANEKVGSVPGTPSTLCPPNEDQLRRELELFALHDGAEPLEGLKYHRQEPPRLMFSSDEETSAKDDSHSGVVETLINDEKPSGPEKIPARRHKSFFKLFQKQSEVDDLLDMYFDGDSQEEPPLTPKKKSSFTRKMNLSRKTNNSKIPDIPPIPTVDVLDPMNVI